MKKKIVCPACGSKKLKKYECESVEWIPLEDEPFTYHKVNYRCLSCDCDGDFEKINDAAYFKALEPRLDESVRSMILNLNSDGHSMACLERILGLPTRTMNRWKNGEYSAPVVALLRILTAYPWIINVIEGKFDTHASNEAILHTAAQIIGTHRKAKE